jgi:hypothetical protein
MECSLKIFFENLFEKDDIIQINNGVFCEILQKEKPVSYNKQDFNKSGFFKTRDEWISFFEKNNIYKWQKQINSIGLYICINPLNKPILAEENVSSYKYILIEFDNFSIEEQFNFLKITQIPYKALIFSGKRSIHIWVEVKAKNLEEYRNELNFLNKIFRLYERASVMGCGAEYTDDEKMNFPFMGAEIKLSRLPYAKRSLYGSTQNLLCLNKDQNNYQSWKKWFIENDIKLKLLESKFDFLKNKFKLGFNLNDFHL